MLFEYAKDRLEVDAVATGHYARSSFGEYLEKYKPRQGMFVQIFLQD